MSILRERAAALADALERHADASSVLIEAQLAVHAEVKLLAEAAEQTEAQVQALTDQLAQPPVPNGPWGPGRSSGLRWWSGCAFTSLEKLQAFVAGPRCGRPVDILQLFGPSEAGLAHSWDAIAGGPGDSPEATEGLMTMRRGAKQGTVIWLDPVTSKLPICYTIRPIPIDPAVSNEDGRRPESWLEIKDGLRDDVFLRLGRRLAYQDAKNGRTAPLILEIGHEMSGAWYGHSIHGRLPDGRFAYEIFPDAWDRLTDKIREGYTRQAGRQCAISFCFRPARGVLPGGVRMDRYVPPAGSWDLIGLSQHDNEPMCCAAAPRANWAAFERKGMVVMEGLLAVAELADRFRKGIGLFEWAGYPPDATAYPGNPEGGAAFIEAMWTFFAEHSRLVAAETFYDRGNTSFTTRPDWSASIAYRARWGAPQAWAPGAGA
jgi:hypothetical protein